MPCKPSLRGYFLFLVVGLFLFSGSAGGQDRRDLRTERFREPNHFSWRPPSPMPSREEWEQRRQDLKAQLRLAAGLWPEPPRTPLNPQISDAKEGDGFTVAKVHFESLPGFLVTGNLYRPTQAGGPFPAILTPHGHWAYGRLHNAESGSIPGRCIDFARQGFVVLSIDMVGYLDSFQFPHDGNKSRAELVADQAIPYERRRFRADFDFPEAELYGFSLGGLQLWNGIRALDFLSSLDEVDPDRIGVTGASGGATQTLLLMTADDRVKVAAPVNIIGAEKHPGCHCENFPGLWVGTSTLEVVATFAPRPLLLVSASEDPWTHSTPSRELPILKGYYDLYQSGNRISNAHVEAGHNYNAESRAAVYAWFHQFLHPPGALITNPEPVSDEVAELGDLRVFPDKLLPDQALTGRQVIQQWKEMSEQLLSDLIPARADQLGNFQDRLRRVISLALSVRYPESVELEVQASEPIRSNYREHFEEWIGRREAGDWIRLEYLRSLTPPSAVALVVSPSRFGPLLFDGKENPLFPFLEAGLQKGLVFCRVGGFASGELSISPKQWGSLSWPKAYNRGNQIEAIQDVLTAISRLRSLYRGLPLSVVATGPSGISGLFGAAISGAADRVVVDFDSQDPNHDPTLVNLLPGPSIRRIGDVRTAVALLIDKPLVLIGAAPDFDIGWYESLAARLGCSDNLQHHKDIATLGLKLWGF